MALKSKETEKKVKLQKPTWIKKLGNRLTSIEKFLSNKNHLFNLSHMSQPCSAEYTNIII